MNGDLEVQVQRALKEAAATYSALIGVQGLPVPLSRRMLAGRLLRANTVANQLAEITAETKIRKEIERAEDPFAAGGRVPQDDNLP
jgi:hypothetical protein